MRRLKRAATEPSAGPNWIPIIKKRLTIQGFTKPDHYDDAPMMMQKIAEYLIAGKIKYLAWSRECH